MNSHGSSSELSQTHETGLILDGSSVLFQAKCHAEFVSTVGNISAEQSKLFCLELQASAVGET